MKRTTLIGSVAAGLMAAAVAAPAWAQTTTYPEGTDCSAILNDASKLECTNQMNESRQNPVSGKSNDVVSPDGTAPGAADVGAQGGVNNQPNGTGNNTSTQQGGQDAPSNAGSNSAPDTNVNN